MSPDENSESIVSELKVAVIEIHTGQGIEIYIENPVFYSLATLIYSMRGSLQKDTKCTALGQTPHRRNILVPEINA
ncbi:MAG: hypothetical protein ABSD41_12575 [Candidatus Bathyarchaeia archaeon]|jgi:hypothetical protein